MERIGPRSDTYLMLMAITRAHVEIIAKKPRVKRNIIPHFLCFRCMRCTLLSSEKGYMKIIISVPRWHPKVIKNVAGRADAMHNLLTSRDQFLDTGKQDKPLKPRARQKLQIQAVEMMCKAMRQRERVRGVMI
jgi:hypothetical protein